MTDVTGSGFIYGLRDLKITTLDGLTQVDLPAAQTLTFSENITSDDLRGDDVIKATVAFVEAIEFSLEAGGISLEAWALMTGETVVTAGTQPNRTETLSRTGGKNFPWIKIYGRALGDGIDGTHLLILKAKLTSLEGNFENQGFFITSASGRGITDDSDLVYQVVKLETDAPLPTS